MGALLLRESLLPGMQPRGAPPSGMLDTRTVIAAMEDGGRVDGPTAAGYLFQSAGISRAIRGARNCVDLGCGTAVQLLQVAALNPRIHFIGVDRSEPMLEVAAARASALSLKNLSWVCDDITQPRELRNGAFDAVISTMSLHDLAEDASLRRCLASAATLLASGGAIHLEDFARLKHPRSIDFFVDHGRSRATVATSGTPTDHFSVLYRSSLRAAFTRHQLEDATRVLPGARLFATSPVAFLCVICTPDRGLEESTQQALLALRAALTDQQAGDLADLSRAFALGGYIRDVFA